MHDYVYWIYKINLQVRMVKGTYAGFKYAGSKEHIFKIRRKFEAIQVWYNPSMIWWKYYMMQVWYDASILWCKYDMMKV